MGQSVFTRLWEEAKAKLDAWLPWYKLPPLVAIGKLVAMRKELRAQNLYDTNPIDAAPAEAAPVARATATDPVATATAAAGGALAPADYLHARAADGTWNDLQQPKMGSVGTRFGRNIPLDAARADTASLLHPNPRLISQRLLTRDTFKPATSLNLLAAAWIQFMTHDWFSHGTPSKEKPIEVQLAPDDPWPEHPMKIPSSAPDPTRPAGSVNPVPTHVNSVTHWWDASQLYGSDLATQKKLRSGQDGQLALGPDGRLPVDAGTGMEVAGFTDNWWIGLSLLHELFTKEHNAVCEHFKALHPDWTDEQLFQKARLVIGALLAKIHTVEWTPAILAMPTLEIAMNANWWGLETEDIHKLLGRVSDDEALSGIPGSPKDHHGVPFSMTEEFVSVYRMHPLLPDDFFFRSPTSEQVIGRSLRDVAGRYTRQVVAEVSTRDLLYSFGVAHPGAITLHNYPVTLQTHQKLDGTLLDLGAVDVLRDRERGVPRYNQFRRLVHKPPVTSFEEITDNKEWQKELREIYDNDVEKVDLMIGMYAETPPDGFGFSDTAFRIFILMASRRLKSDRFYTTNYNAETYTKEGLDWIDANTMMTLILRHHPDLQPALDQVKNGFAPWNGVGPGAAPPPQPDDNNS